VTAVGLSADYRFVMAYDAARTLSLLVVRAAGYRPPVPWVGITTPSWRWRRPTQASQRCLPILMAAG